MTFFYKKKDTLPGWESVGVIGAIVPWNFPLMLLTWKVTGYHHHLSWITS